MYLKNYQIWHHRSSIMAHIDSLPPSELPFLANMLAKDAKNYHVWSYRQWLVRRFDIWDAELPSIESLLEEDVRNNSAWNHRWYCVFLRYTDPTINSVKNGIVTSKIKPEIIQRELEYTKNAILLAPQNPSPWKLPKGFY